MTTGERQRWQELDQRVADLARQLEQRASLYRLLGADEIGDEFERLRRAELGPMAQIIDEALASQGDSVRA